MSEINENDEPTAGGATLDDMMGQELPSDDEGPEESHGQPGFAPVFGTEEEEEESTASQKVNAFFNKTVGGDDISLPTIVVILLGAIMFIGFVLSMVGWYKSLDDKETWYSIMMAGFFLMVFCILGLAVLLLLEHMVGGVKMFKDKVSSGRGEEEEDEYMDEYEPPAFTSSASEDEPEEEELEEELEEDDEYEELEEEDEELDELEEEEELEEELEEEPPADDEGMIMPSDDSGFVMPDKS